MKKAGICLIMLLYSFLVVAQEEKNLESKITHVTVFLNKAQVIREAKARLEAGKTVLVMKGLTSRLDQQSIQVTGKGNFTILSIAHRQNFLNDLTMPRPIAILKDSIDLVSRQIQLENTQKEILNKEEQMLMANQRIGGTNQNLTVAELKGMADFYRSRLSEIASSRMKEDLLIRKLSERLTKLQQQLNEQNELYSRNTSEILVTVSADAVTTADLTISYVVSDAGWYAVYDLRAVNTKSPVQLSYKANVYQSTGEDWKNVRLKLSTANPSLGGVKPELYAWYLDFYEPQLHYEVSKKYKSVRGAMSAPAPEPAADMKMEEKDMETANTTATFVNTVETTLNTEFDITLPYTVPSSNKPALVDIRNHELKSEYIYSAAPKLDADAFLLARATGWEEFSLLPGEANVFFEGTFVGKSYIDPNSVKDTLDISLGRDKRIVVKREKLKDFTSKKLIGTNKRESYAYEISVRNTKAELVKITLEDQVPVSQNGQIEITVIDAGGSRYNKDTGKLVWDLTLQPNESKKLVYKFDVKYPKDKIIAGL